MVIKRIVLFMLAVTCVVMLHGQEMGERITNAGTAADYPNGSTIVTLFDSTFSDVQESGLCHVYTHKLYKILTPKGAKQHNVVKIGYDPLSAYVEIPMVVVYRNSGAIDTINNPVLDYPAPARAIYWGAREKMVEVGRLEVGDAIEVKLYKKGFTYALLQAEPAPDDDARFIPPMRGHFYDIVAFWSDEPILEKVYQMEIPNDKQVQYKVFNGTLEEGKEERENTVIYTFVKKDIMPVKREGGMVSKNDVLCKLLLSTSPDWEAKSTWFFGVNDDYGSFIPTPEVKAKVDELLIGAGTEMDSIAVLTHWVADNMRYSGISMGEGEGFTLHNAAMNFKDRCGVCKDKASLLIAMLRAAGFNSYAAMTMAGERIDDIPADQFNHSITVVQLKDDSYMLLDPTWVPGVRELWSSAEQQQGYLMGLPDGADLMYTPVSAPENHYLSIKGESKIEKDGTLIGTFTVTAEGQSDAAVRGVFSRSQPNMWRKNVERELLKVDARAKVVEVIYTHNDDYLKTPVRITYHYEIPNYAFVSEEYILFTPLLAKNVFKRAMSHLYMNTNEEEKQYPFKDRCSRLVEIEEEIKMPSYKKVKHLPEVEAVAGENVSFEGGYTIHGRTLKLEEKISLGKRIYEPEEWPDFKQVVEAQRYFSNELIILKR